MTLNNDQTRTHNKQILAVLKQGYSITPEEARQNFGCMRLSARIYDLRAMGIEIVAERRKFVNMNGNRGTCCIYHLKTA